MCTSHGAQSPEEAAGCDVIYARNIDMLMLAVAAKAMLGLRGAIAYEVLDVQRPFMREDAVGTLMRWAERRLMSRSHDARRQLARIREELF